VRRRDVIRERSLLAGRRMTVAGAEGPIAASWVTVMPNGGEGLPEIGSGLDGREGRGGEGKLK